MAKASALGELKLIYGTNEDSSFLVRYFEDFYAEVIRQKQRVIGTSEPDESGHNSEEDNLSPTPESIIQTLKTLLERQAIDAARFGGEYAAKYYIEAQFIMAALADEIFLHMDWNGKEYWERNLLESAIFGTHTAGEVFFTKLEDFLRIRDPGQADIAMLYLLALGLGFEGKYSRQDDKSALDKYRKELFIFAHHRDPSLFIEGSELVPDAQTHTLDQAKPTYLYDFRPWLIIFLSACCIILLASLAIWYNGIGETHKIAKNIITNTSKK